MILLSLINLFNFVSQNHLHKECRNIYKYYQSHILSTQVCAYPLDYYMIFIEFDQSDLIFRGGVTDINLQGNTSTRLIYI